MIENTRRSMAVCFCLLALTAFAVAGCDNPDTEEPAALPAPAQPLAPSYVRLSPTAPPDPMPEIVPPIDDVQHEAWRPGYWSYDEGQFAWVQGAVIQKPTFTAVWMSDRWEKREYGWAFIPGHWQ